MARINNDSHILVLCMANRTRSPIAAAMLKKRLEARGLTCTIESAGVLSGEVGYGRRASRGWSRVAAAAEYDLSGHISRHVDDVVRKEGMIYVCAESAILSDVRGMPMVNMENVYVLNPPRGIPNPDMEECTYDECFLMIHTGIAKLIEKWGLDS